MCLDLLLPSRSAIPGAFWRKGQMCVRTSTRWKTSWERGYFWITADTREKNCTLISRWGHWSALCGPNAERRQISNAPGQSDRGSAEGTGRAVCVGPGAGGLCRSLERCGPVGRGVGCPGLLLHSKINGRGFILPLSLQTKVYWQWTYGSRRQRPPLKLTPPEEKFKKKF